MIEEKLRGINVYLVLLFSAVFLYLFITMQLYMLTIIFSFALVFFISYKFSNFPLLILHYVNPYLVLHLQSYVLWLLLTGQDYDDNFIQIYLKISVVAILTFNLIFLKFVNLKRLFDKSSKRIIKPLAYKIVKYSSTIALLIYLGFFFFSGFHDKRAIKDFVFQHPFLKYLYALSNLFLVCIFYELLNNNNNFKKQFKLICIYGAIFLLVFLIIGERDLLFSLGVACIFIYSVRKKKFLGLLYYFFTIIILFIGPYTQLLKSALTEHKIIPFENKSFELNGFDDFMTSGFNTKRVYNINGLEPVSKNLIISDIGNLFDLTMNSGRWYNRVYLDRPIGTTGFGFSFPLVGYLDYKYLGVFFVYSIISIIAVTFFNKLQYNHIGIAFVIFLITLISYVQRQDLAFFLNFSVKFILIPYFFLTKRVK